MNSRNLLLGAALAVANAMAGAGPPAVAQEPVQPGMVPVVGDSPYATQPSPAPRVLNGLPTHGSPGQPGAAMGVPVIRNTYTEAPGTSADNPTARQEPAVSIEWIGPGSAKVNQPVSYQLIIKNISAGLVEGVGVKATIPTGVTVNATEPKANMEGDALVWALGNLEPRQEKRLDVQLTSSATGAVACQAAVTITGTSTVRLIVHEPKLAIKAAAPEKVIVGDPATVGLTITNPGDAVSEHVKVTAKLSDGLEHARGSSIDFDLGNMAPKETRTLYVLCGAKSAGSQKCEVTVSGDPKLQAQDSAAIEVLIPKVELAVTGPGMRYLDRHAVYTLKVTNPGTATANHVRLVDEIPQGFTFAAASNEGRHDFVSRTVSWFLGDLPPGQSQEVTLDLVAVNTGEHKNRAAVGAARGLRADNEIVTRIEGLPALLMELVDLDDPVEVGSDTSYEIRVTNTGTKTETNLQLTCTIPDKMEFKGAKAPSGLTSKQEGADIVFDPIPKLAPRADVIYRVNVRGTAPGDLRFRARIKADGLSDPVLKEESTKVYGDERLPQKP
ncbi:MAG: DUF11 domain-containing protein [Gemmataceae bacterium]|nr:DUF11 domain-containing protein [Gemmataceae bacterium]